MYRLLLVGVLVFLSGCTSMQEPAPETILVGGATGRQGQAVVNQLLARGYQVRALTRDPESETAQELKARGVDVVRGDYADTDSLLSAMAGINRMFFYSGFARNEVAEGESVIAAAKESGIEQLVYSSGAAADPANGVPGAAKMQVELAIEASGVPYTVVRPVAFMENFDRQQKRIASQGIVDSRSPDRLLHFISIEDVGFFVGEAFDHPGDWLNKGVNIASDRMTVRAYVDTFSNVTGRQITYTQMPLNEYLETLPKPLRPLFRWYDEVGYQADVDGFRAAYPQLTTLDTYLRATGWGNWQP